MKMLVCDKKHCNAIVLDYESKKGQIAGKLSSMKSDISNITSELNSLSVPDDYIGSKVVEKIKSITTDLSTSEASVESFKGTVNSYIQGRQAIHAEHYEKWKAAEEVRLAELRKAMKAQSEGDTANV